MFSIYTTLYLIKQNGFPFLHHLRNFSAFGDEVIVGTCAEGIVDGTLQELDNYIQKHKLRNVKVEVSQDIVFSNNRFDGQLKNFALQKTKNPVKIQADFDEVFPLRQRLKWEIIAASVLRGGNYDAIFVPSIDLWLDEKHIRKNHKIGQKWRIHRDGLQRGVPKFAELPNGLINTSLSDTTELNRDGHLVPTAQIVPDELLEPQNCHKLDEYLYTLHFGYISTEYRLNIGKNWWAQKWFDRSHKQENIPLDEESLTREPIIQHGLNPGNI